MSRRDTIIIAVLLNAGLLIVLFATSLKSEKVEEEPPAITVLASNEPAVKETSPPLATAVTSDQVDRVIEQYVTPQIRSNAPEVQNPHFLADLQPTVAPASTALVEKTQEQTDSLASPVNFKEVKVKQGDVLDRIARQNHVSVSEIMKVNQLTSTRLKIGQVLKIPTDTTIKTSSSAQASGPQYYTIKAGDNPWTIAVKHHMKVEELLKLNHMDEQKARRLKAGDKIRIN